MVARRDQLVRTEALRPAELVSSIDLSCSHGLVHGAHGEGGGESQDKTRAHHTPSLRRNSGNPTRPVLRLLLRCLAHRDILQVPTSIRPERSALFLVVLW